MTIRKLSTGGIIPVIFLCILSAPGLFGKDTVFLSLSYSPAVSDYRRLDTDPVVHTCKGSPGGVEIDSLFLVHKSLGLRLEAQWNRVNTLKITDGTYEYESAGWNGLYSQYYFSPQLGFVFSLPRRQILMIGAGPSVTTDVYSSPYGSSFSDIFLGISLFGKYYYIFCESFFIQSAFRFTTDFFYYGGWNTELLQNFIQFQYVPSLGCGFSF